ncbi:MAG: autotransporter assembly complex family protein [Desulfobacteraceae bacterium]|jgi:translocation and assembly module TamA
MINDVNNRSAERRSGPFRIAAAALCVFALSALFTSIASASGVEYSPRIQGAPDEQIEQMLKDVADTFSLREKPPASVALLRKRAIGDVSRMVDVLRSEGYYGADVVPVLEGSARPVEVQFRVNAGPRYTLASMDLRFQGGESPFQVPDLETETGAGVLPEPGAPARADAVLEARDDLLGHLKNHGYPFADAARAKAFVNHAERTVRIELAVDPGPRAVFGEVRIAGLEDVEERFVLTKTTWEEGALFNASLLEKTRERLIATGLFATVEVKPEESLDRQGRVPIQVTLKERKHRTVGFGLRYHTDEGPGIQGSWKHRNFFGEGERLSLDATLSPNLLMAEGGFHKPEFLHPDQSLLVEGSAGVESPEAYTSRHLRAAVGLERRLSDSLVAGGGIGFKASRVDQLGEEEGFGLLSLPLRLDWDTSNDLLDPQQGWRLAVRVTPFVEVLDEHVTFTRTSVSLTHYLEVLKDPGLVLATRWKFGSILGAEWEDIPADERFYAGGGGSVRGLPFQTAGPLDGTDPVGGRSLVEVSAELRMRLTRSLGLAAFLDGGRAFESSMPDFEESLLWGAGVGVRYFTFLGPLRLDVAVPLDRREKVDDAFQVYVSIGQAF